MTVPQPSIPSNTGKYEMPAPFLARLAGSFTGARASLLALLAVVSMTLLFTEGEMPLVAALQVAVALQRDGAPSRSPDVCTSAVLNRAPLPFNSFDGRPAGYSEAEALQILCAMRVSNEAARRAYLDRHFPFDMAFAVSYALAFSGLLLFLLRAYGLERSAVRFVAIVPLLAGLLDAAENLAVRGLVVGELPPNPILVRIASSVTVLKFGFVCLTVTTVFVGLLWYLLQNSIHTAVSGDRNRSSGLA